MRALELLVAVDTCVESWEPGKGDTVDRLHRLAGRGWRPQDTAVMDGMCDQLERWTVAMSELVGDAAVVLLLQLPCPSCNQRYVYRRSRFEETVRSDALRVSESGAECLGCRAEWAPDQFEWLARLLGCPALPV